MSQIDFGKMTDREKDIADQAFRNGFDFGKKHVCKKLKEFLGIKEKRLTKRG